MTLYILLESEMGAVKNIQYIILVQSKVLKKTRPPY